MEISSSGESAENRQKNPVILQPHFYECWMREQEIHKESTWGIKQVTPCHYSYSMHQDKKSYVNLAIKCGERCSMSVITDDCLIYVKKWLLPPDKSKTEHSGWRWKPGHMGGKGRDYSGQHRIKWV